MISFFGLTEKAYCVLKALIEQLGSDFIDMVISAKDRNIENDYFEDICALCKKHGITFKERNDAYQVTSNYLFAIGWRWLIEFPSSHQLIVFHDSLLPKYRGFSPLVNMLINGEDEIGVTALFATDQYDKGDIIFQSKSKIHYPIKINEAIKTIIPNYIQSALHITQHLVKGLPLNSQKQNELEATYSLWRDENDYKLDWKQDAVFIKRFVDATGSPYKGASTILDNDLVRIVNVTVIKDLSIVNRDVGKVIYLDNKKPVVVCGNGLIRIDEAFYENGESLLPLKKFRIRFI